MSHVEVQLPNFAITVESVYWNAYISWSARNCFHPLGAGNTLTQSLSIFGLQPETTQQSVGVRFIQELIRLNCVNSNLVQFRNRFRTNSCCCFRRESAIPAVARRISSETFYRRSWSHSRSHTFPSSLWGSSE